MRKKNTGIEYKYAKLSELGSDYNLSFSSHLTLGDNIMALDGTKKKLLIAEIKDKVCKSFLIKLEEIKAITLKKIYTSIKPGELGKKTLTDFLKAIHLRFEYEKENNAFHLPFYEREVDKVEDIPKLERKARNWYIILSKLANTRNKQQAQLKMVG